MALVPDMPMTLSGKVLKRELLEQWAAAQAHKA
jgi:acyl-coenzyme A synthetase/AMP-(fatty) acid ligase